MRAAFYTGASGLLAFQHSLDTTGNNLANVSTTGYKPQSVAFEQLLSTQVDKNTQDGILVGNGVRAVGTGINPSEAAFLPTGGALDVAISGDGWFCVDNNGTTEYTRDGAFSISLIGGSAYLVDQKGAFVLDSNERRISAAVDSKSGSVDTNALLDRVGVFTFLNPGALVPVSSNRYLANGQTGPAVTSAEGAYTLLKGYLEQSGVSLSDEMVSLIKAQRGYQLSARVVSTADEMEQTINSLRN